MSKGKIRQYLWPFALMMLLLCSGCDQQPSNQDLIRALAADDPYSGKLYELKDLVRRNGFARGSQYDIEYQANLAMIRSVADLFSGQSASSRPLSDIGASIGGAADIVRRWGIPAAAAIAAASPGEVIPISGTITLIKSEKGWVARAL